jgi:DNA-binding NarL/FixJ family response regulator
MVNIVIADSQPLYREALGGVLEQVFNHYGWVLDCAEAGSVADVMCIAGEEDDLQAVLLDLSLLGAEGLSQLVSLRRKLPSIPLIILSSTANAQTMQLCMTCGAAGFISKSSSRQEIAAALRTVFDGSAQLPILSGMLPVQSGIGAFGRRIMEDDQEGNRLSGRQAAVLDLVADGKSNKQIAWELSISETTVKAHMTAILRKLGVNSRAQAIVLLQRHYVQPPAQHLT